MSISSPLQAASPPADIAKPPQPSRGDVPAAWRKPAAAVLLLGGLYLAFQGAALGLVGALAVAAGCILFVQGAGPGATSGRAALAAARRAASDDCDRTGRAGAQVMVAQVVPVWSRQLEVTRDAAAEGLANILQSFTEMNDAVDSLTRNLGQAAVSAAPGAVDSAVRSETPALQALTSASARAFEERDRVMGLLQQGTESLKELQHLAKQARGLARHTRLVAFNASIEANRTRGAAQAAGSLAVDGAQAIAAELRTLASRMAETGEGVDRVVTDLMGRLQQASRQGHIHDTSPEELRLEIDLRARDALTAMLAALGSSLHNSVELQQAGAALRDQVEAAFVNFQFGDRISQMLNIVSSDMNNFTDWVAEHPNATQSDAAEWLAVLEASYTMDEQRSSHHGNVVVDHNSGVEFF